MTAKQ